MATKKVYHHLKDDDRSQLYILNKSLFNQREIADLLGINQSTVQRELKRNSGKRGYRFKQAQKLAQDRRKSASKKAAKKMTPKMLTIIVQKLRQDQWSPEQISGWLKKNLSLSISHETIYTYIWKEKKSGGNLYTCLRRRGKKYNKRGSKNAGRGLIPNRIDISERPDIVDQKTRIGDWELDTIIGKNHIGALVSAVDRKSKFTKLMLVLNKTARQVTDALVSMLTLLKTAVHTMTADNGKEFAFHQEAAATLEAAFYFARPYRSWERGLNEHTNGLVRQYFPKKTRFDTISQDDVLRVQNLLNSRPRKILNFKTPLEVLTHDLPGLNIDALRF
jgi:IS30 family transposase